MSKQTTQICEQEFDFAIIANCPQGLTPVVEDALFEAGCDDVTLSIRYGLLYLEFSRSAQNLQEAIVSAILDIRKSELDLRVIRVDECNLVSASDIARRSDRSRQMIHQYMTGKRGPGGFPPPVCNLADHAPLWAWCAVSYWLVQNQILRAEESMNAEVVQAINMILDKVNTNWRHPGLVEEISTLLLDA